MKATSWHGKVGQNICVLLVSAPILCFSQIIFFYFCFWFTWSFNNLFTQNHQSKLKSFLFVHSSLFCVLIFKILTCANVFLSALRWDSLICCLNVLCLTKTSHNYWMYAFHISTTFNIIIKISISVNRSLKISSQNWLFVWCESRSVQITGFHFYFWLQFVFRRMSFEIISILHFWFLHLICNIHCILRKHLWNTYHTRLFKLNLNLSYSFSKMAHECFLGSYIWAYFLLSTFIVWFYVRIITFS